MIRSTILLGLFGIWGIAWAAPKVISIAPGESYGISDTSLVYCIDRKNHYCKCAHWGQHRLYRVSLLVNGKIHSDELDEFRDKDDCNKAIASHPACK